MLHLKIQLKITIIILFLMIFPVLSTLILLDIKPVDEVMNYLGIFIAFAILMIVPLSKFLSYFLVNYHLNEINRLCVEVKKGNFNIRFDTPVEKKDENEIIKLKRNLNWMLYVIMRNQKKLQSRLTETDLHKKKYENLANKDPLTYIYNRRFFEKKLIEIAHDSKQNNTLILMMIDADKFKSVNDTMGHQVGDDLLVMLADIMQSSIRKNCDFPFRYGGDEFGIIFTDINSKKAQEIADRIRTNYFAKRLGETSLSIGIAKFHNNEENSMEENIKKLIQAADQAVYSAKMNGGNCIVIA